MSLDSGSDTSSMPNGRDASVARHRCFTYVSGDSGVYSVVSPDFFLDRAKLFHSLLLFSLALSPCHIFHVNIVSSVMRHASCRRDYLIYFFFIEYRAQSRGRAIILCLPLPQKTTIVAERVSPGSPDREQGECRNSRNARADTDAGCQLGRAQISAQLSLNFR